MTRFETQPGGGRPRRWPALAWVAGCALGALVLGFTVRGEELPEPRDVPPVTTEHEEPDILSPPPAALSVEELSARLQALEAEHAALLERIDGGVDDGTARRAIRQTRFQQAAGQPNLDRRSGSLSGVGASNTDLRPTKDVEYGVGYDAGFYLRPKDPSRAPYEMVVNGRMQFRYVGFAREREFWVNSAGDVLPISNASFFEIERGRLSFSGFMLDEKLEYFINLDFDTDDADRVVMHDFWVNYEFSRAFDVYLGKSFVPGSRDWLNGSLTTRFADRSLATTFFRPDRTTGIWVQGEPFDRRYYRMMVGDGFNTFGLQPLPNQIDDNFVYAVSLWADLGADSYGRGYSDLQWHERLVAEVGTSFTFAREDGPGPVGEPRFEQNFIRLADGTNINTPGALAPGVVVNKFDIALWAVDAAWKWRGFSANGEYYFRQLSNISGTGPLPTRLIYNHGYYLEGGYMLIPGRFEVNARTSQIFGDYGPSREYAGGVNWFPKGSHNWKWTFDCSQIYQSAAQNSGPNYIAGETGVLFRLQLQAAF